MESILLALSGTTTAEVEITNSVAVIYSVAAGLLGLLISLTYMKTGNRVSKNFARTLITLPILYRIIGCKWKFRNIYRSTWSIFISKI